MQRPWGPWQVWEPPEPRPLPRRVPRCGERPAARPALSVTSQSFPRTPTCWPVWSLETPRTAGAPVRPGSQPGTRTEPAWATAIPLVSPPAQRCQGEASPWSRAGVGNLVSAQGHADIYHIILGPHTIISLKIGLLYSMEHLINSPRKPWQGRAKWFLGPYTDVPTPSDSPLSILQLSLLGIAL